MKNSKLKILISNVGFGDASPESLNRLKQQAYVIENTARKKFSALDFVNHGISDIDVLIAGTEIIDKILLQQASKLKLIARVGVGLDNIDLQSASDRNIAVSYTPDAPAIAVPEFTLALILNLIKGIALSDRAMHQKKWVRPMGNALSAYRVGVIGAGKIGKKLISLLLAVDPAVKISFFDPEVKSIPGANWVSFDDIFSENDLISIHVPLSKTTRALVGAEQLRQMPSGSYLVNTARGGIVDEDALYDALQKNLKGAAIDVFEDEPYNGKLSELENCLLTSHIGSMNFQARALMEEQVLEEILNFMDNKPLIRPVKMKEELKSQ